MPSKDIDIKDLHIDVDLSFLWVYDNDKPVRIKEENILLSCKKHHIQPTEVNVAKLIATVQDWASWRNSEGGKIPSHLQLNDDMPYVLYVAATTISKTCVFVRNLLGSEMASIIRGFTKEEYTRYVKKENVEYMPREGVENMQLREDGVTPVNLSQAHRFYWWTVFLPPSTPKETMETIRVDRWPSCTDEQYENAKEQEVSKANELRVWRGYSNEPGVIPESFTRFILLESFEDDTEELRWNKLHREKCRRIESKLYI